MSENKRRYTRLLDNLANVVSDMYGENAAALEKLTRDMGSASGVDPTLMQVDVPARAERSRPMPPTPPAVDMFAAHPAPAAKAAPARPALPPFEALWKTADESIDWTEALVSPTSTDPLTSQAQWTLYHQQADAVLHGDPAAYLTVLRTANPMADLMPFVTALDVRAENSDELSAAFAVRPDLMDGDAKRYISGMAVRIARDLFAVLPVLRVTVRARQADGELLHVVFTRQAMNKVRFAFIDPVAFVEQCSGSFGGAVSHD